MKTLLLLWAFVYVLFTPTYAHDWGGVLALVQPSVIRLQHPIPATDTEPEKVGTCSGFVIGHVDTSSIVMTANHCLNPKLRANDGYEVSVMVAREDLDMAIVRVIGLLRPSLRPNRSHLKMGHMVAGVGYAFSLGEPMGLPGYITHAGADFHLNGRRLVVMDKCLIPGMSGGPMVDASGRVVGLLVSYNADYCVGYGRPINDLWEITRPFWQD